jgi:hypothetical protein
MTDENIEFVLVTFYYDLAQFYILCLSIKKYHNTQHKIKIIYNHDGDLKGFDKFEKIVKEHLCKFDVTLVVRDAEITSTAAGWTSQQILKWYLAYYSTSDWQVVLDSKNFYIKPFVIQNLSNSVPAFSIPPQDEDNFSNIEMLRAQQFIKNYKHADDIQQFSAMTPWIWKPAKIQEMLDAVWPNKTWIHLNELPGTEWFLYLAWIGNDIKYHSQQLMTGIWGSENIPALITSNLSAIFWTHHRFAQSDESINLTKSVIKIAEIASEEEINEWLSYVKYFNQ